MINQVIPPSTATQGTPENFTVTVTYDGADEITDGYLLALNNDYGGDTGIETGRTLHVEKPSASNIDYIYGFVEQENRLGPAALLEDPRQVFLRLADVLVHDAREVDLEDLHPQVASQYARRHGLPGARRPVEQRRDPGP